MFHAHVFLLFFTFRSAPSLAQLDSCAAVLQRPGLNLVLQVMACRTEIPGERTNMNMVSCPLASSAVNDRDSCDSAGPDSSQPTLRQVNAINDGLRVALATDDNACLFGEVPSFASLLSSVSSHLQAPHLVMCEETRHHSSGS